MPSREKILENLADRIRKCKRCSLWKGAKNAVPGEGSVSAKIIFIGEAPGREDDLTGRPFFGRAGKLLTLLLEKNGLKRKKVFITSVIKHRPPKNRLPKKLEIEACKIWWGKQLEVIKPKTIVLLGKTAFDAVIGEGKFSDFLGKFITKKRQRYFVAYHPAAGLRSTKFKKVLERDFKKLFKSF